MDKILIIGAKGNLGCQLVKTLSSNYDVIGWDKEEVDVTDKALIAKKIADVKPKILINCTAYNAVDKCEEDRKEFEIAKKLNGSAVGYMAQAALKAKCLFVHFSTDYVFSGNYRKGYKESDQPDPINNYGISKLKGEQEVVKLSGKGLKWYLVRTSKLFGPKGVGSAAKPSFFDIMLDLSREKDELKLVDEEVSCFTYTVDLADAVSRLISSEKGNGIYHLTNSNACTWYEAARELFKIAGNDNIKLVPIKGDDLPRPAKRPKFSKLLNTKLEPLRDYREALREYLENIKNKI